MKFSKLLQVKSSRIKTKLNIDKCLTGKAEEKRECKNKKRIRDFKASEQGKNKLVLRWSGKEQNVN